VKNGELYNVIASGREGTGAERGSPVNRDCIGCPAIVKIVNGELEDEARKTGGRGAANWKATVVGRSEKYLGEGRVAGRDSFCIWLASI